MDEGDRIDPRHAQTRLLLRLLGPAIATVGLIFLIIGLGSFFSSFGTFAPPRYFWCAFVGLPLLFVGGALTTAAFLGAVARYAAGEGAPVQKDTFNYLARGTQEGVRTIATAVGEGLSTGTKAPGPLTCPRCRQPSDADARFCKHCGAALAP